MFWNSFWPLFAEYSLYFFVVLGFSGLAILLQKLIKKKLRDMFDALFLGVMLYLFFFVLMRWIQLPSVILLIVLFCLMAVGFVSLFIYLKKNRKCMWSILLIFIGLFVLYGIIFSVRNLLGGVDAKHYTIDMSWAMSLDWLNTYHGILGKGSLDLFVSEHNFHRSAISAFGWLNNLVDVTINVGTLQRHIFMFTVLGLMQFYRFLGLRMKSFKRIIIFIPLIFIFLGALFLRSVLALGQANTALAIFLLMSLVYYVAFLCKNKSFKMRESYMIWIICFLLFVSYTEIIWMIPLFIALALLAVNRVSLQKIGKISVAIMIGLLPITIYRFSEFIHHAMRQSKIKVGAYPLGKEYIASFVDVMSNIVYNSYFYTLAVGAIIILSTILVVSLVVLVKKMINNKADRLNYILKLVLIFSFVLYYFLLIYVPLQSTLNQSYMVFKLASWSAPLMALLFAVFYINYFRNRNIMWSIAGVVLVSFFAVVSAYASYEFMLRYRTYSDKQSISFVKTLNSYEVSHEYSRNMPLYDPIWVNNLVPWHNSRIYD